MGSNGYSGYSIWEFPVMNGGRWEQKKIITELGLKASLRECERGIGKHSDETSGFQGRRWGLRIEHVDTGKCKRPLLWEKEGGEVRWGPSV